MHRALPKISIVTAAFKAEATLETTIRSVVEQGYPNLEYIVIDGAGDGSAEVIRRHESRLAYWCSEPDEGQYPAIDKGFAKATGDILGWLNADDILLPGSLQSVGEVFGKFPEIEWLSSLQPGILDARGALRMLWQHPGFSRETFLDGFNLQGLRKRARFIQQESTFFRRGLWESAGAAIPGYPLSGDFALWCEFHKRAELVGIDYPLSGFRQSHGQRSSAHEQYFDECLSALVDLRRELDWRDSFANSVRDSLMMNIPQMRRALARPFGYSGKRVTNSDFRKPVPDWRILNENFLPL